MEWYYKYQSDVVALYEMLEKEFLFSLVLAPSALAKSSTAPALVAVKVLVYFD